MCPCLELFQGQVVSYRPDPVQILAEPGVEKDLPAHGTLV
jgi:hypothetical protein